MTTGSTCLLERKTVFSGIPSTHRVAFTEQGRTIPRSSRSCLIGPPCPYWHDLRICPVGAGCLLLFISTLPRCSRERLTWLPLKNLMPPTESHGILQNRRGGGGKRKRGTDASEKRAGETCRVLRATRFWTRVREVPAARGPCLAPSGGISNGLSSHQFFRTLNWWVF